MKRLLSLILVVVMLFAALAMVACGEEPVETTEATTTEATTTAATTTVATTTAATTTAATTTKATTTVATTKATTKATTTVATTKATTTAATTTEATTTEATTTATTTTGTVSTTGTTVDVFARFDYGTKSKAIDEKHTSHEYLVSALEYNKDYMYVDYDEDNMIVFALQDYDIATMNGRTSGTTWQPTKFATAASYFELVYDDLSDTYEFEGPGEANLGWGSWNSYPYSTGNVGKASAWCGRVQYMQIRFINGSENTTLSARYKSTGLTNYFTTGVLAFEGVTPASKLTNGKDYTYSSFVTDANYQICTFDCVFCVNCATGSNEITPTNGKGLASNWVWRNGPAEMLNGIRFSLLGAFVPGYARSGATYSTTYSTEVKEYKINGETAAINNHTDGSKTTTDFEDGKLLSDTVTYDNGEFGTSSWTTTSAYARFDTRGFIRTGCFVVVDYIIFGSSPEQLDGYKSYIQESYEAK